MLQSLLTDLDYVSAGLHCRRSQLAEGERLVRLCGTRSLPEFGRAVYPNLDFQAAGDFQRRLAQDLVKELQSLRSKLSQPGADLVGWFLVRFQVENVKVLLRQFMGGSHPATPEQHLLSLPQDLTLDEQRLLAAHSLDEFCRLLPRGTSRRSLARALESYRERPEAFFLEGALDCGYFGELLSRARRLREADRELVSPIMLQEADAFHLMLVTRGRFHYGLAPDLLRPLHVKSSGISSARFNAMLGAHALADAVRMAVGFAIDVLPSMSEPDKLLAADASRLEALCWKRFVRLSNRAIRRSHIGLATVIGYIGIRRVEVANLVTASEGIATGIAKPALLARVNSRTDPTPAYV